MHCFSLVQKTFTPSKIFIGLYFIKTFKNDKETVHMEQPSFNYFFLLLKVFSQELSPKLREGVLNSTDPVFELQNF